MKITVMDIDRLTPYPGNPRNNDAAVDAVANSIRAFGFRQPIVADESGTIIAGHTRYAAAKVIGLREVPVHIALELTQAQCRAYRLADNRAGELSQWDFVLLEAELDALRIEDIDLSGLSLDDVLGDRPLPLDEFPSLPSGERSPFQSMTFTLHDAQAERVFRAIKAAKAHGPLPDSQSENSNGNAIDRICAAYLESHGKR